MFKPPLKGLIAATITPFTASRAVDRDAIAPMIDRLIESGITGLYVCGSTGEGMSLTCDERKIVVEASVDAAAGRVPVIVQVGHNSLADARDLAAHAQTAGADVISATCPSYFKVNHFETLARCMLEIASSSELPFYYYHIPALTGSQVSIEHFLGIASQIPNFAGMKYTTTTLHEFQSAQHAKDGSYDIVWGCDEMLLAAWATGAQAAIGSTYNIAAPLYRRIIDALDSGDMETARDLQFKSVSMVEVLKRHSFHAALKSVMRMLGMPGGPCRLPLEDLCHREELLTREALSSIGFFEWCGHTPDPNWHSR